MAGKNKTKGKMKSEIEMPDGISASVDGKILTVKGPKGDVKRELKQHNLSLKAEGNKIIIYAKSSKKMDKTMLGSMTAHIKNMLNGSQQSHVYTLKICSGHFPMMVSVSNNKFTVKNMLGEKVPRVMELKHGAEVKVEGDIIHVTSTSKEIAGQVSADIEQLTRRPGYDTRVFQDGIYITNKDGKEIK